MTQGIFDRAELLLGSAAMQRISEARVIVLGTGGVGSWCAEGLVRSGIRHLTIVDNDVVSVTNVNRQLMATTLTVGQPKVQVLRERLMSINPDAEIRAIESTYSEKTSESFELGTYDFVIDCIDSLKNKIHLLMEATRHERPMVLSSMGAALKLDTTQIKVGEFWKVRGCPLGSIMRKRMRQRKITLSKPVMCVYSEELLENKGVDAVASDDCSYKAQTNGSMVHITGTYGFTLCGLVIANLQRMG
ncbi:MAG: tRNA threonylcarbamoyladenosine dehydratase [Prevotella sp.]|nr:tRNA threonylcarbamoyladenosine dehydratase [Candidatus Prevotella equi]